MGAGKGTRMLQWGCSPKAANKQGTNRQLASVIADDFSQHRCCAHHARPALSKLMSTHNCQAGRAPRPTFGGMGRDAGRDGLAPAPTEARTLVACAWPVRTVIEGRRMGHFCARLGTYHAHDSRGGEALPTLWYPITRRFWKQVTGDVRSYGADQNRLSTKDFRCASSTHF